ncbi:hypothetical protein N9R04_09025 [Staphylococcus sp. SQ8-PEA]|uniref:Uncharacterized protein n=1 Tax=Staphylococcus marylandisciuri TaxID=2981529 RepID=A0ABT2QS45_9STAP|nr:hypothetical protein [Staphylococcus marylandisciuri]MCU5746816.1 hypothetical protein [Staphylococcus marylandisciuri]
MSYFNLKNESNENKKEVGKLEKKDRDGKLAKPLLLKRWKKIILKETH